MGTNELALLLALNGKKRLLQLEQEIFSSTDDELIALYLLSLIEHHYVKHYDYNAHHSYLLAIKSTMGNELDIFIPWAILFCTLHYNKVDNYKWHAVEQLLTDRFSDSEYTTEYFSMVTAYTQ